MFPFFWEDCTRGNDLVIIELMNDVRLRSGYGSRGTVSWSTVG